MVYKSNIPQPSDFISQSQVDMSENFEEVRKIWGQPADEQLNEGDHIPLNNPEDKFFGKHKKTTFVEQEMAPTTLANEVALYTKDTNSKPELFYRRESDGTEAQLTDRGNITVGGMVLGAWVLFDFNGNIINKIDYDEKNKKIKVPLQYNVSTVTVNKQTIAGKLRVVGDYTIGFENSLPDANYCWIIGYYQKNSFDPTEQQFINVNGQAHNAAAYSTSVSTSTLRINMMNYLTDDVTRLEVDRISVQVYRMAG